MECSHRPTFAVPTLLGRWQRRSMIHPLREHPPKCPYNGP